MFIIKAEADVGTDDHCERELFLVSSILKAKNIVNEFNSAAKRYQKYIDAVGQFRLEYERENPLPILEEITFPSGLGSYQDDRYMTVDDEYLQRVKYHQQLLKENDDLYRERIQAWTDNYNKQVQAKFSFSWDFPYADQLTIRNDLHDWAFFYKELKIICINNLWN